MNSFLQIQKFKNENGFTLLELIVVIVIIGILSSIAIPSFKNTSIKAKQSEAAVLINAYIKATQLYFLENGNIPMYSSDLKKYVEIDACRVADPARCKTMPNYSPGSSTWTSRSGIYTIRMQSYGYRMFIYAVAAGDFTNIGLPVVGCFNSQENISKVHILKSQLPYLNPYGHSC